MFIDSPNWTQRCRPPGRADWTVPALPGVCPAPWQRCALTTATFGPPCRSARGHTGHVGRSVAGAPFGGASTADAERACRLAREWGASGWAWIWWGDEWENSGFQAGIAPGLSLV